MLTDVNFTDEIRWVAQNLHWDQLPRGHVRKRVRKLRQLASHAARDESAAMTRCGILFEEVVRIWLSQYFTISYNRTLTFSREEMAAALEIDTATYDAELNPEILFEVGFSVTGVKAIRRKAKQLRRALYVAQNRWPQVRGCIILVDAGLEPVPGQFGIVDGLALDEAAFRTALLAEGFAVLVLRLEEMWSFAQRTGVPLCDELRAQVTRAAAAWRQEFLH